MADDPPKKAKKSSGAPAWMCTFADMMSLLLCFFVLILSFSSLDQPKFDRVTGSLRDAFGFQRELVVFQMPQADKIISPQFDSIPFSVKKEIEQIFLEQLSAGLVEIEEQGQVITLRVKDSVAFDSGRAEIKDGFKVLLDKLGKIFVETDASLIVAGHTDNVPLRPDAPFRSNWSLSTARAVGVVEYLATRHGIPAHRLSAAGHADGEPVASNADEAGRSQNRRVEFKIRPGKSGKAFEGIEELVESK